MSQRLRDLDESALLRQIFPIFADLPGSGGVSVPAGDDAAVVAAPSGSVIATTDSMVRGRDWRDDWSSGHDVGWKLVAQNVADVAAMGGVPTGLLVSLMVDPEIQVAWVLDFAAGVAAAAQDAGCPVLGGDLSSAPAGVVVVSITALGDLGGRAPVLRSGARVGDVVAVCGSLGWSGAGLATYAAGLAEPSLSPTSPVADRDLSLLRWYHRVPRPPYEAGPVAAAAGASAMLDISDGLVRDGRRIAAASGVSLELSREALAGQFVGPVAAVLGEAQAWEQVLGGGEEHSLLATFAAGSVPDDERAPWWVIGTCVAPGPEGPTVLLDGIPASARGWDHFHP